MVFLKSLVLACVLVAMISHCPANAADSREDAGGLGFWEGTWKIEAEATPNAIYPAGKYTASLKCDWFEGKHHMICRFDWVGPEGPYSELQTFGYNTETETYDTYDLDSTGFGAYARATRNAGTWTYLYEMQIGGKPVKMRWNVTSDAPGKLSWKTEIAEGTGPFKLIGRATGTRVR